MSDITWFVADIVNQGIIKKRRGVRLYACAVSLCAHAVVLSVFAAVQFTRPGSDIAQAGAVVGISRVKALSRSPMVMPKPRVVGSRRPVIRKSEIGQPTSMHQRLELPGPDYQQQKQAVVLPERPAQAEVFAAESSGREPAQVEFFGSVTRGRRICYVVDCSGSMQGLWRRVRDELFASIGGLQPDQYFCVIVFGAGSVLESGGGKMERATERAKKDAYGFIDALRPAGVTNALAAIQQAVKIRDGKGVGPSAIYLLTDGFELGEQDGSRLAHQVATILRSFSPNTQINTIGFWPGEQDRRALGMIAGETGGEFVVVNDGDIPETMSGGR